MASQLSMSTHDVMLYIVVDNMLVAGTKAAILETLESTL